MPILFPALKPSTRSFTVADYPVTLNSFARGIVYPRLRAQRPNGALLELTFSNIADADAASILEAFALSRSGFHSLILPTEIVSGINLQALKDRIKLNSYLRWHFNDPPKVDAGVPGISTVSVTLVATLSRNTRKLSELAASSGAFALNGQAVALNAN